MTFLVVNKIKLTCQLILLFSSLSFSIFCLRCYFRLKNWLSQQGPFLFFLVSPHYFSHSLPLLFLIFVASRERQSELGQIRIRSLFHETRGRELTKRRGYNLVTIFFQDFSLYDSDFYSFSLRNTHNSNWKHRNLSM